MGHLLLLKRKSNLPKIGVLAIVLGILPGLGESYRVEGSEAKAPIYVSFFTHMQRSPIRGVPGTEGYMGQGPAPYSLSAKRLVDLWEKYGVKGEYGTTGLCLQQLLVDFPETVKKIKQLKLPVSRYPGAGHEQPCPIGRMRFTTELPLEEAIHAEWEFETQTLTPEWHLANGHVVLGNTRHGKPLLPGELVQYNLLKESWQLFGGILAIEAILGVIPLDLFEARFPQRFVRTDEFSFERRTPVLQALGIGSYAISYHASPAPASRAPALANVEGLRFLEQNWPRRQPLYMEIAQFGRPEDEEVIKFLTENPSDFKIIWPDPEGHQWDPKNSAAEFFRKTYGLQSLEEARLMQCPVKSIVASYPPPARNQPAPPLAGREKTFEGRLLTIKDFQDILQRRGSLPPEYFAFGVRPTAMPRHLTPSKRAVSLPRILEASEYLLAHWPQQTHDGDPGGPPDCVETSAGNLSLCEVFQGLAFGLDHYVRSETLPGEVEVQDVLGPVDYPMFRLAKEPRFDPAKRVGGYQPFELDLQYFPQPDVIKSQGLLGGIGAQTIYVDDVDLMDAATKVARFIREEWQIPAVTVLFVLAAGPLGERSPRRVEETKVNATELLYAMAQEVLHIRDKGLPGRVLMKSAKILGQQRCKYIMVSTPVSYRGGVLMSPVVYSTGFVWREKLPSWTIDAAWNYTPDKHTSR